MTLRLAGIDIFCFEKKFLVFNLVSRNLKIKYRRSALGFLWTLLVPLATAATYYFIFTVIIKVQTPHYLVLILSGVLPWAFFAQTVIEGTDSIVSSGELLSKVPIPPQVFPFVVGVTNLVSFLLSFPVLLAAAVYSGAPVGWSLFVQLYYVGLLFLMAYGVSLFLAQVYVYLRDLKHVLVVFFQLWFYGTPVLYGVEMIPETYQWLLYLNPVGLLFSGVHRIWVQGMWPTAPELWVPLLWTAIIWMIAVVGARKMSRNLVEYL